MPLSAPVPVPFEQYDKPRIVLELKRDEGVVLKPYTDTVGKTTIGVGRNLTDVGITMQEAEGLLLNDIIRAERALDKNVPWWREMSDARQRGLLNMCFNMGWGTLSEFKTTLGHLKAKRYAEAATACLKSKWAKQVGARANRIAEQFRVG